MAATRRSTAAAEERAIANRITRATSKLKPVTPAKQAQAQVIQAELDRAKRLRDKHEEKVSELEDELERLTKPQEPDTFISPPPVIRFKIRFEHQWVEYNYAAMGYKGEWYLTQNGKNHPKMRWARLLDMIPKDLWDTIEVIG